MTKLNEVLAKHKLPMILEPTAYISQNNLKLKVEKLERELNVEPIPLPVEKEVEETQNENI